MTTKTPFIIYAESTPNPEVMKFVSNKILTSESKECLTINEAEGWPLLQNIFQFPFVKEIFIASNYISIKKHLTVEWFDISNQVRIFIQDQLNNDVAINLVADIQEIKNKEVDKKSALTLEIEKILETSIRPSIQMDGGDIELVSCKNGIIKVFLKGACSGCPSSQMTLKNGIEVLLKEKFPKKIKEVIAINT